MADGTKVRPITSREKVSEPVSKIFCTGKEYREKFGNKFGREKSIGYQKYLVPEKVSKSKIFGTGKKYISVSKIFGTGKKYGYLLHFCVGLP